MGLIEVKVGARGGAFVTAPNGSKVAQTMSDMMLMSSTTPEDVVEARLIVELGTVSLACARATKGDLADLRDQCLRSEAALAAGAYTREMSWDFHAILAHAAHNGAVDGLTQSFRSSLSLHPMRVREGIRAYERTVAEHLRIVEALERRDGSAARREMAEHLLRGTSLNKRSKALLALWEPQRSARRAR
jgi:DNA-binding FadR family transcriptional regulator